MMLLLFNTSKQNINILLMNLPNDRCIMMLLPPPGALPFPQEDKKLLHFSFHVGGLEMKQRPL
jgi:hypothetical protein